MAKWTSNPKGVDRLQDEIVIKWLADETDSASVNLSNGSFGTIIVPSALNGKGLNVVAVSANGNFADTELLSADKPLTTGANAFTADEITEVGAAAEVKFRLDVAHNADVTATLLWKS